MWMLQAFVMSVISAPGNFKTIYLMEEMFLIRVLLVIFTGLFKIAVVAVA